MKRIREEEIFPRNPNKTYGLMELVKGSSTRVDRGPDDMVSSWPHLLIREAALFAACFAAMLALSVFAPPPLELEANAQHPPNPAKAPWYFLGLQEMLVYFDPWMAGVVLPTMIIVGLVALPYIDFNQKGNGYFTFTQRKFAVTTFLFGFVVLWVTLIVLGTFLRGPNWNFFGPYEYWDLHKLIPLNNVNLSEIVWIQLFGKTKPESILIREAPGIILCLAYFTIMPYLMYRLFFKRYAEQAGMVRYFTLAVLLLFMAALPIKMVLRWTINLKYLVAIPEYFFNI